MNTEKNITVKPGYKTTEFWLILLGNIILAAVAFLETIDTTWAAISITVLNSIYALSRMGVKATVAKGRQIVPLLILFLGLFALTSCAGESYRVDTTPYASQIEEDPANVVMDAEHVTPIGGFQTEFGTTVRTEQGEIGISDRGLSGNLLIDLRNGK